MGKLIYLMVALKQFLFLTPSPVTITLDGNKPQTFSRTWFAAVMNQKYEGGGFKFCPDASPEDGLLDVIVIEGISKLKMLFCLPSALWENIPAFAVYIFYSAGTYILQVPIPFLCIKTENPAESSVNFL